LIECPDCSINHRDWGVPHCKALVSGSYGHGFSTSGRALHSPFAALHSQLHISLQVSICVWAFTSVNWRDECAVLQLIRQICFRLIICINKESGKGLRLSPFVAATLIKMFKLLQQKKTVEKKSKNYCATFARLIRIRRSRRGNWNYQVEQQVNHDEPAQNSSRHWSNGNNVIGKPMYVYGWWAWNGRGMRWRVTGQLAALLLLLLFHSFPLHAISGKCCKESPAHGSALEECR